MASKIVSIIESFVQDFLSNISEKYSIDIQTLQDDWKRFNCDDKPKKPLKNIQEIDKEPKKVKKIVEEEENPKNTEDVEESKKSLKKTEDEKFCIYKFVKPPRTGEVCGSKIKNEGSIYCSKHKMYENKTQAEKKTIPKSKSKGDDEVEKVEKTTIALRLNNKIGKFVHPLSGMVFFSKDEKVVYGKLVKDSVERLDEKDIETCKKYGFKIDQGKFVQQKASTPKKEIVKVENIINDNTSLFEDDLEDN